jgi:Carboxypeptidase regulatory-like domain
MTNLCISHQRTARRWSGFALFATLCVLTSDLGLLAQSGTSSALSGVVTDSSGAVIPAATVFAVEIETRAARNAQTNPQGAFLLSQINPGTYEVSVKADGFAGQRSQPTIVPVGRTISLNFTLHVSSSSETVTVEARQGLLSLENPNTTTTLDSKSIKTLPNPGQDTWCLLHSSRRAR